MKLELFVVSHKEVDIPSAAYLMPIRSDRTDGDNIAEKENYCELRAQYWVWKNKQLNNEDYVGFFHYRRYLELNKRKLLKIPSETKRPIPYQIKKKPNAEMYSKPDVKTWVSGFEVIAPVWEYTGVPVWKRYQSSPKQRLNDLEVVYKILSEKYPAFISSADRYLSGKGEYYGNIYIMRWDRFQKYCSWLFDILEEFDRQVPNVLPFTDGFLGERLFGIYFTWLTAQESIYCAELPRLHFSVYDDEIHHIGREYFTNLVLCPGSRYRSLIRKIAYELGEKRHGKHADGTL